LAGPYVSSFVEMMKAILRSIVIVALFCPAVSLMAQQTSEYQLYKVAKGDNYYKLSKKFNCSAEDIQKANDNKTVLKLGETIKIPVKSIAKKDLYENAYQVHTVSKGETLNKIAIRYGTTIDIVKKINNMSGDQLKIGQKIKVPAQQQPVETHPERAVTKPDSEPIGNVSRPRDTVVKKSPTPPGPRGGADVNPGMPEKTVSVMNDFVTEKEEVAVAKVMSQKMEDTRTHVMHPTLPKGNIIVVLNPQSGRMAYCKVVDNYTPRQYEGSGLIMTPAVADKIGINGNMASVKIKYAAP
jgi:LysM repeat protein